MAGRLITTDAPHLPQKVMEGLTCRACGALWPCKTIRVEHTPREIIAEARSLLERETKTLQTYGSNAVMVGVPWLDFHRLLIAMAELADLAESYVVATDPQPTPMEA